MTRTSIPALARLATFALIALPTVALTACGELEMQQHAGESDGRSPRDVRDPDRRDAAGEGEGESDSEGTGLHEVTGEGEGENETVGEGEGEQAAPIDCSTIPSGGACGVDADGDVVARNCRDGQLEETLCYGDMNEGRTECTVGLMGAHCMESWELSLREQEAAFLCIPHDGGNRYTLEFTGNNARFTQLDANYNPTTQSSGTFETGTSDGYDWVDLMIPGVEDWMLIANQAEGVVAGLLPLQADCIAFQYDVQATLNTTSVCFDRILGPVYDAIYVELTLEPGGYAVLYQEQTDLGSWQDTGAYYLIGNRIFIAIADLGETGTRGWSGTVVNGEVIFDDDMCDN